MCASVCVRICCAAVRSHSQHASKKNPMGWVEQQIGCICLIERTLAPSPAQYWFRKDATVCWQSITKHRSDAIGAVGIGLSNRRHVCALEWQPIATRESGSLGETLGGSLKGIIYCEANAWILHV